MHGGFSYLVWLRCFVPSCIGPAIGANTVRIVIMCGTYGIHHMTVPRLVSSVPRGSNVGFKKEAGRGSSQQHQTVKAVRISVNPWRIHRVFPHKKMIAGGEKCYQKPW